LPPSEMHTWAKPGGFDKLMLSTMTAAVLPSIFPLQVPPRPSLDINSESAKLVPPPSCLLVLGDRYWVLGSRPPGCMNWFQLYGWMQRRSLGLMRSSRWSGRAKLKMQHC
jgi:hypothetical protein